MMDEVRNKQSRYRDNMVKRFSNGHRIEIFVVGDSVSVRPPATSKITQSPGRLFCKIIQKFTNDRYRLLCDFGILKGWYHTADLVRLDGSVDTRVTASTPRVIITLQKAGQLKFSVPMGAVSNPCVPHDYNNILTSFLKQRCNCKSGCK